MFFILTSLVNGLAIQVSSIDFTSDQFSVQALVQNIAFTKKIVANSCASTCSSTPLSYVKAFNSTHEVWSGAGVYVGPVKLRYDVSGQTFFDNDPNGNGYAPDSCSVCTVSTVTVTATSFTTLTSFIPPGSTVAPPVSTTFAAPLPSTQPSTVPPAPTLSSTSQVPAVTSLPDSTVIMQAWDWATVSDGKRAGHFDIILSQIDSLAAAGINGLWLPPITESVDPQGYFPTYWYRQINAQGLANVIGRLKANNMSSILDFVANHRGGVQVDQCTGRYTKFVEPDMGNWAVVSGDQTCDGKTVECPSNCGCGAQDSGQNFCSGPDLDHTNPRVRQLVLEWVTYLKSLGFDGIRVDQSKGYSGSYQQQYVNAFQPSIAFGEFYDGNLGLLKDFLASTGNQLMALDFPLYFVLQRAIANNNFYELNGPNAGIHAYNSSLSVTFISNHDILRTTEFGTPDQIIQGYAFILTHPGIPCVFWTHYQRPALQPKIVELIKVRKQAGITKASKFTVVTATKGLYSAYVTGSNGRMLAMKLGTSDWSPSDSRYKLVSFGNNFAVWIL